MDKLENTLTNFIKFYFDSCRELYKELDMSEYTKRSFEYLKIIRENENLTSSELSKISNVSKPSICEIIQKFIKHGLVYKEQSLSDKRVYYIKLTKKGELISKTNQLEIKYMTDKVKGTLNESEINYIVEILDKIGGV